MGSAGKRRSDNERRLLARSGGPTRVEPQGKRDNDPRNNVDEPVGRVGHAEVLDDCRQPVTQAVSGERECHVVEAHQQDAAIEQRPKSVFVVCFLHSAVFGCQRLAQPVLFFGV
jgi:hypothetical protein